jgi:hypothetical protein
MQCKINNQQNNNMKVTFVQFKKVLEQLILLINSKLKQAFSVWFFLSVAIYTILAVPLPQQQGLKLDLFFTVSCLFS